MWTRKTGSSSTWRAPNISSRFTEQETESYYNSEDAIFRSFWDVFDAVISVGVFTQGHAPANSFDELARITKPGGLILFSLRVDTYESDGFKEQQTGMENAGVWRLAEVTGQFQPLPKGEPEVWHRIWAYRVK